MSDAKAWLDRNQAYLVAELDRVRRLLEREGGAAEAAADGAPAEGGPRHPGPDRPLPDGAVADLPLPRLAAAMGLSPFEQDLLLLCAGVELDARFAGACAQASGDRDAVRARPTFSLALRSIPGGHWSALRPESPLRAWRLLQVEPAATLVHAALRIDERILHFLCGLDGIDPRLAPLVVPVPSGVLPPSVRASAEAIARHLRQGPSPSGPPSPLVVACGPDAAVRQGAAAWAAASAGLRHALVHAADLPAQPAERDELRRGLEREWILDRRVFIVEAEGAGDDAWPSRLAPLLGACRVPLLVSCRDPQSTPGRAVVRVDVAPPTRKERRDAWREHLGPEADALDGALDRVADHFRLGMAEVQAAARDARLAGGAGDAAAVWAAGVRHARPRFDGLARRVEAQTAWDDLVLPAEQMRLLRALAAHLRHRSRVLHDWGFGRFGPGGLGCATLFTGPSGTGKTYAASAIANDLGLDLWRVDLSQTVNKYIGETEKNLGRIFDAGEAGGCVLLFDEADVLFSKRTELRDSHDKYANLEVGYLLQRMEEYGGLAILTTNLRKNIDPAFLRRLRFIVDFPFPEAPLRRRLWERAFPAAAPTQGIDPARLAGLAVSGGTVRVIAHNAAVLAADEGGPIRMAHVLQAARAEHAKQQILFPESEFGGDA